MLLFAKKYKCQSTMRLDSDPPLGAKLPPTERKTAPKYGHIGVFSTWIWRSTTIWLCLILSV